MKKCWIAASMALCLFMGSTLTTSAAAGNDHIQQISQIEGQVASIDNVDPQATPAVVGGYALRGAAVAAGAFVAGVTAEAGSGCLQLGQRSARRVGY